MSMALALLFGLVLAGACFHAFQHGGKDEKQVAAALVAASLVTPLAQAFSFSSAEYGILVVDAILLLFLLFVSLTSARWWPMVATGFQLAAIETHLAAASIQVAPLAYADLAVFWSYLVIAALFFGTMAEAARSAKG